MAERNRIFTSFGCCECGAELEAVWFTEDEYASADGISYRTGRQRRAVSHLVCPDCLRNYPVDDSFDGPWH